MTVFATCRSGLIVLICLASVCPWATSVIAADAQSIELPATDDGLPGAGPIRRYDGFKGLWTERRSAWAKRIEQDQKAVVFLGDISGFADPYSHNGNILHLLQ